MGCGASQPLVEDHVDLSRFAIVDGLATDAIAARCSRILLDRLSNNATIPRHGFRTLERDSVVLVVDITGFTMLGQKLSALGRHGAESLSSTISAYLGPLVDKLVQFGASVECFGGDAIFALFGSQFDTPTTRLTQAAACALVIARTLGEFHTTIPIINVTHTLSSHLALAFGTFASLHVGGYRAQWRRVTCGSPLLELDVALGLSKAKEVVVTKPAAAALGSICQMVDVGSEGYAKLVGWAEGVECPTGSSLPLPLKFASDFEDRASASLVRTTKRAVAAFIDAQKAVQEADLTEFVPESRRSTVLFVGLGIDPQQAVATDEDADALLAVLHTMFAGVQKVLTRFDGRLSNFLADEKGYNVVASFGAPAHEDDPLRGVIAGLLIQRELAAVHQSAVQRGVLIAAENRYPTIGITTGTVMFGRVGSRQRSDEALLGSPVNLAARLMTYARMKKGLIAPNTPAGGPSSPFLAPESASPSAMAAVSPTSGSEFDSGVRSTPVLIDNDTARAIENLPTAPPIHAIGKIQLKGFAQRVSVFAPDVTADVDDLNSASFASFIPQPSLLRTPHTLHVADLLPGAVQVGHFVWPPAANAPLHVANRSGHLALTESRTVDSSSDRISAVKAVAEVDSGKTSESSSALTLQASTADIGGGSQRSGQPETLGPVGVSVVGQAAIISSLGHQLGEGEGDEGSIAIESMASGTSAPALQYSMAESVELQFYPVVDGKLFARAMMVEELILALKSAKGSVVPVDMLCVVAPERDSAASIVSPLAASGPSTKGSPTREVQKGFSGTMSSGSSMSQLSTARRPSRLQAGIELQQTEVRHVMYPRCVAVPLPRFLSVAMHPILGVPSPLKGPAGTFSGAALIAWSAQAMRVPTTCVAVALQLLGKQKLIEHVNQPATKLDVVAVTDSRDVLYRWTPLAQSLACERGGVTSDDFANALSPAALLDGFTLHRAKHPGFHVVAHDQSAAEAMLGAPAQDPYALPDDGVPDSATPGLSTIFLTGANGAGKSLIIDMVLCETLNRCVCTPASPIVRLSTDASDPPASSWFTQFQILHTWTSSVGPYAATRALLLQSIHRLLCLQNDISPMDSDLPSSFPFDDIRSLLLRVLSTRLPTLYQNHAVYSMLNEILEMDVFDVATLDTGSFFSNAGCQPCFLVGLILAALTLQVAERVRPVVCVIDDYQNLASRPLDGTAIEVFKNSLLQYRNSGVIILAAARPFKAHPLLGAPPGMAVVPVTSLESSFIRGLLRDVMAPLRVTANDSVVDWFLSVVLKNSVPRAVVHAISTVASRVATREVSPLQVVRRKLLMPSHVTASELSTLASALKPGLQDTIVREVISKLDSLPPRVAVVIKAAATFTSNFTPALLEYVIRYAFNSTAFPLRHEPDGRPRENAQRAASFTPNLLMETEFADAPLDMIISHLVADKWLKVRSGVILCMADPVVAEVVTGSLLAAQRRAASVLTCRILQRIALVRYPPDRSFATFAWQLSPFSLPDVLPQVGENPPPVPLRSKMKGAAGQRQKGFAWGFENSVASAWSPIVAPLARYTGVCPKIQGEDGKVQVESNFALSQWGSMLKCVDPRLWVLPDHFVEGLFEKSLENVAPYGFLMTDKQHECTAPLHKGGAVHPLDGLTVPHLRVIRGATVSEAIRTVHFGYLAGGLKRANGTTNEAMGPILTALCVLLAIDWDSFLKQDRANTFTLLSPEPTSSEGLSDEAATDVAAQAECNLFPNGALLQFVCPPRDPVLLQMVQCARLQLLMMLSSFAVAAPGTPAMTIFTIAMETCESALALEDPFVFRFAYAVAFRATFILSASTPKKDMRAMLDLLIRSAKSCPDDATQLLSRYLGLNLMTKAGEDTIAYALNETCMPLYDKGKKGYDVPCLDELYDCSSLGAKLILQRCRFGFLSGHYGMALREAVASSHVLFPRCVNGDMLVVCARSLGNLIMFSHWAAIPVVAKHTRAFASELSHPFSMRLSELAVNLADVHLAVGNSWGVRRLCEAHERVVAAHPKLSTPDAGVIDAELDMDPEMADGGLVAMAMSHDHKLHLTHRHTIGTLTGRALLKLKEAFVEFGSWSAALHRSAYFFVWIRTLPLAWLSGPKSRNVDEELGPMGAPSAGSMSGISQFPAESVPVSLRYVTTSVVEVDTCGLMSSRLSHVTELTSQLTPSTFASRADYRVFIALAGVTFCVLRLATGDHPRAASLSPLERLADDDANTPLSATSSLLPQRFGGFFEGRSEFDPATSLFEMKIWCGGDGDVPQPVMLQGMGAPSLANLKSLLSTNFDGPADSAGAVVARALVLLSSVVSEGRPKGSVSQRTVYDLPPFPMLKEWTSVARMRHSACEALRDLVLLMHPAHPLAAAVRDVTSAGRAVTAASVGLAVDSAAPTTPHNALLGLNGDETVMAREEVIIVAQQWLDVVEADKKGGIDADDGPSTLVESMVCTIRWALKGLREAQGVATSAPARSDKGVESPAGGDSGSVVHATVPRKRTVIDIDELL